jgi:hypothetical protein
VGAKQLDEDPSAERWRDQWLRKQREKLALNDRARMRATYEHVLPPGLMAAA